MFGNKNKKGIGASIGSFFHELSHEVGAQFGELGNDIVKGVTMLPFDLIRSALSSTSSSESTKNTWANEWLKNPDHEGKIPISEKEGAHSTLNIAEMFKQNDAKKQLSAQQRIARILQGQFTGQHAQRSESVYVNKMQELAQNQIDAPRISLSMPESVKKGRGSLFFSKKRKSSTPQDLNRTEYKGSKGQG